MPSPSLQQPPAGRLIGVDCFDENGWELTLALQPTIREELHNGGPPLEPRGSVPRGGIGVRSRPRS